VSVELMVFHGAPTNVAQVVLMVLIIVVPELFGGVEGLQADGALVVVGIHWLVNLCLVVHYLIC
jgi:hypothetical protein